MRAVSLHRDVILVTSALLQANCTIVRGPGGEGSEAGGREPLPPRYREIIAVINYANRNFLVPSTGHQRS